MIPILYGRNEKLFRSNGICRLVDCISCLVTEERNGTYECEFEYPITGENYDKIQEGCIIYTTHDHTKSPQPFDIYKRSAPIDGIVTFYASHISYRLNSIILKPFTAVSCAQALSFFASHSVNDNPFTFWTDKDVSGPYSVDVPSNIREKLCGEQGSILNVYGTGEYEFDKWDVKLHVNRGQDTSVSIRYGKNLIDLTNEIDIGGIYNAVAPFWKNSETGDVVTLPEYYLYESSAPLNVDAWTEQHGDIITEEDAENIEFGVQTPQIIALDLSEEFEEQPTVEELRDKAAARLANSGAWLPRQNIELDFVNLSDTYDYSGRGIERLNLCDTAEVIYTELGVNVRQKVIKTVYNSLLEKYDSMELGSARQTFAEALESVLSGYVAENYSRKSAMVSAIERATNLITGGLGGHVIIGMADGTPNEILIMDTEDKATAVNVLRINQAGIGFSSHGYNGPFDTAWTLDGHFVADYITSGTLDATLLKAGTITDDLGNNFWNLETGEFRLSSAAKIDNAQTVGDLQSVASGAATTANAAQTTAGNAQTTANSAVTAAGNAQTTANSAVTAAGNAQTTADSAVTAAGNAQTTADSAVTAAGNAQTTADSAATAAANAQTTADGAQTAVTTLDTSLDTTGVFNRLTNNGTLQGLYMQNGELYMNASYIQAGTLSANMVRAGTIQSEDGLSYWNLDNGNFVTTSNQRSIRMTEGYLRIFDSASNQKGYVGTFYVQHQVNGNYVNTGATALGLVGQNVAIGLSRDGGGAYKIYLNDDDTGTTSPYGYTQKILFFGSELHSSPINLTENSNIRFLASNNTDVAFSFGKFSDTDNGVLTINTAKALSVRYKNGDSYSTLIRINNGHYSSYTYKQIIFDGTAQFLNTAYFGNDNQTTGGTTISGNGTTLTLHGVKVAITGALSSTSTSLDVYGAGIFTGSVSGTSFINTSDERKKNFLTWNPAYDSLIDVLTPQLFKWKEGGDDTENIGFSAQKVKKALEDRGITESGIVHEDEDGYLSLNYNSLTLLLFNRIKTQDAEIKQLNDRIATLERMVQNLCKSMNCPQ